MMESMLHEKLSAEMRDALKTASRQTHQHTILLRQKNSQPKVECKLSQRMIAVEEANLRSVPLIKNTFVVISHTCEGV